MMPISLQGQGETGDISDRAFERLRGLIHRECGIALAPHKRALMRCRLRDRVQELGLESFDAYADLLESGDADRQEWTEFLDRMTTNKTSFFRERTHIDYLTTTYLDEIRGSDSPRTIRGWCAACSSGQEPTSIVMALLERLDDGSGWNVQVNATDLSRRMLAKAKVGRYTTREAEELNEGMRERWTREAPGGIEVVEDVRRHITYTRHNLMNEKITVGRGFDFVFCRNVMIYFDAPTRAAIVRRLAGQLRLGGILALGLAESLVEKVSGLQSIQTALYRRVS